MRIKLAHQIILTGFSLQFEAYIGGMAYKDEILIVSQGKSQYKVKLTKLFYQIVENLSLILNSYNRAIEVTTSIFHWFIDRLNSIVGLKHDSSISLSNYFDLLNFVISCISDSFKECLSFTFDVNEKGKELKESITPIFEKFCNVELETNLELIF